MLDSWDIDCMAETLGELLSGKLTEHRLLSFAEPDLNFDLYPAKSVCNSSETVVERLSRDDGECYGNLLISIWAVDGLTNNKLKLYFSKDELQIFFLYLQLATNKISIEDANIKLLIEKGYITFD